MRLLLSVTLLVTITALAASDNPGPSKKAGENTFNTTVFREKVKQLMIEKKSAKFDLGTSPQGRIIEAWFFPGSSDKNALVIGGVHGSELSSIEVVNELIKNLNDNKDIYYNTIVIPSLFPDNAAVAMKNSLEIGSPKNLGRYSFPGAPDPNRQMPTPGAPFDEEDHEDHTGRKIEEGNILLLQLIEAYRPQRIASVHAIRNTEYAGFFADPRTDENGIALGYAEDSSLALTMAQHVHDGGGKAPGNRIRTAPTALYYKDPIPAQKGYFQKRNFTGSPMPGYKGSGVSLGTWASTAVKDPSNPANDRDAIRILTIEFPGSKRPADYTNPRLKQSCSKQVKAYASAIQYVFLQEYYVEENMLAIR